MKKKKIKAIHDTDLVQVLKDLGVYNDILSNKKKCTFCRCVIDLNNLQGLFPASGDIKFICSEKECLRKANIFLNENKHV